jgi:gluconate 5-dehydrogenase
MEPTSVTEQLNLAGKTALVTGGTGYLGYAMATGLAEAGASVVIGSRYYGRACDTAGQLPATGQAKHYGVELDHLDEVSLERGFNDAVSSAGQIDILVNNGHEATPETWRNATRDNINRQLANASGYFLLARLLRDHAVSRHTSASVILLGSMYGCVSSDPRLYQGIGPENPVAYQMLKGGVIQLARHLAVHWAADNIRVNCLSPGPFPNVAQAPPELMQRLAQRTPLGRIGHPHELKGAVVFLASAASSFLTGQNLIVDGGWTAW